MIFSGKYNKANVPNLNLMEIGFESIDQIKNLCNLPILKDSNIAIMPDVCPGIGTTIGSTFTYQDMVIPSLVSSDIGCGITTIKTNSKKIEPKKIDKIIQEQIIERKKIDSILNKYQDKINLNNLYCEKYINIDRCYNKLIDLGGGNHFFECDKDSHGYIYFTVHSGSRLLGQQIYDYYIDKGYKQINDKNYPRLYTYLKGELMEQYLHDMNIAIHFAQLNRKSILETILKFTKLKAIKEIDSVHNYIDTSNKIIRKGAISANKDEELVIPISASQEYGGIIIGVGLGNKEWNYSAPHGAGRICSRKESKDLFSFSQYKKEMENVYSSCVSKNTIDESPMVYKKLDFIKRKIKDTINISEILTPIYNYKQKKKA